VRIVYVPTADPVRVHLLEKASQYQAKYFDPTSGERRDAPPVEPDGQGTWRCAPPEGIKHDWVLVLTSSDAKRQAAAPISIHPQNPKYFLFRGKPLALITASEHYGSVVNRAFNYRRYLDDAADKKQTLTRTFLLFREQQNTRNPSSPIKPESPDFIAPYPRTGPGTAMDGEPIYDLDQWNPEYFSRLHDFLDHASKLGIVVELTLLSNTYGDPVWALNPLRSQNNQQKIGSVNWADYTSLKDKALVERQKAHVRKIVSETSRYDNVYYEICNEPGGGVEGHATPADVDAWQAEIARTIRDELKKSGSKHLVFGQQAFSYTPKFTQPLDACFTGNVFDAVNVHPLPNTILGGRGYQLGNFMSRELMLDQMAHFCRASQKFKKPSVQDEDNTASLYRDDAGWTIHRKRAWTSLFGQNHYDYIDFSITAGSETGTAESGKKIRTWMKHLSEFFHALDFIHLQPLDNWIQRGPEKVVTSVLAKPGQEYLAYLADAREVTDPSAGSTLSGPVTVGLPAGTYRVALFSPTEGVYSPAVELHSDGKTATFYLPPFKHDIVIHVTRGDRES